MAKYIGPKTRISRKFGELIYGSDKNFEKRKNPPGQHGAEKRRRKTSEYGTQLNEKQKAKYIYGVLERHFEKLFTQASHSKGVTGEVLLQLLESRLDNVVYRLSIAPTRAAARQLVSHCHITVNGDVVNISSYQLKPGDIISVRERSKSLEAITKQVSSSIPYKWLEWDKSMMTGKFMHRPERSEIPENIKEQLIVELYSK